MNPIFLDSDNLPFCKGCSHSLIARNMQKALQMIGAEPLDVIIVTDIGCHGIIDASFLTHTVHGLHGRSAALGAGISAALSDPAKKVIVLMGDGGSTIGLNHLIGAASRNFNMTVLVLDNMLYGMTGGQQSDLTPPGFFIRGTMAGFSGHTLDLFDIIKNAGAAYVSRIAARGDFSGQLAEAFRTPGFSLVEILEVCPSYGLKYNREINLKDLDKKFAITLSTHKNPGATPVNIPLRPDLPSLFADLKVFPLKFEHRLEKDLGIIIGGSAGEGVQLAGDIFARAALASGLQVTRKGSYPVTVGTGFSVVEIILSTRPIRFTAIREIHWAVISSPDGLKYFSKSLEKMNSGNVIIDDQLEIPHTKALVMQGSFRTLAGAKDSILMALLVMLYRSRIFDPQAFIETLKHDPVGVKIDIPTLNNHAKRIAGFGTSK